jgi:hypothetical protein
MGVSDKFWQIFDIFYYFARSFPFTLTLCRQGQRHVVCNQKGSSYGVGYYGAQPGSMMKMREMIINRHPAFLRALECYEAQTEFVLGGEAYKKSKFPAMPDNLRLWLDKKNIYFESTQNGFDLAFSKELPDIL